MATQFTSGEWLVADRQPDRGHDYIFADNVVICEQPDPLAGRVAGDDWMQNRHLLAASKKLYAACEAVIPLLLLAAIKAPDQKTTKQYNDTISAVNLALAAARGEVQP